MNRSPSVTIIMIILFLTLVMAGYVFIMGRINIPAPPQQTGSLEQAATSQQPAPSQPVIPTPNPESTDPPAKIEEDKNWTGFYVGRIDNNFIEIKVGNEIRAFLFPEEATGIVLNKGDAVSFEFYKDKDGRTAISSIKKLLPE